MHHQVCVALMGLPFKSTEVHTPEFYINVIRRLLERDVQIDSVCMKDASGTTDPNTVYQTAKGIRALLPGGTPLWMHTHDTASMAIACYMAAIEGGADGIDLSVRPLASGTVQPDVRSMWHALKGTGYALDIDHEKMNEIENMLQRDLSEYDFDPVTTTPDARVVGFPMPGGAIGPNVHMMKEAGILDKYSDVLAEFPVVVKAAGAWTSVTPGSQQYWLQAFNNVLHGRWKKIEAGYGKAVLGYFGQPPLKPDAEVVKLAAQQLEMEPFFGDPLEAAPDSLGRAKETLKERNLPLTDENIFLVAASIVPGRNMDLNEGIRLLTGNARIVLPLKQKEEKTGTPNAVAFTDRITTSCTIEENGRTRTFNVVIDPPRESAPKPKRSGSSGEAVPIFSPFDGKVEVVEIRVKPGDSVREGQVVAAVEAMKAKHDVKAPCDGLVQSVDSALGATVARGTPILTLTH
jgi:pyruvate carboxylase subunit B